MSTSSGTSTLIVLAPAGAPARRSLTNLRRRLAQAGRLQGLTLVTTTSAGAADGSTIVSTDLAGGLDTDAYKGAWVMPTRTGATDPGAAAALVRRVGSQALAPVNGQLNLATGFGSQIAAGVDVEIHHVLPPVSHDRQRGLRHCLNMALAELWFPQRQVLAGVNSQGTYDLSALGDWLDTDAIRELFDPALSGNLNPTPHTGFQPWQDGESIKLGVAPTLQSGTNYGLEAYRPGDTWIKQGGVWTASTVGLAAETDECLFQPDFVVSVALAHVYDALAASGDRTEYWAGLATQQRVTANWMKLQYLQHTGRRQDRTLRSPFIDPKDFSSWPTF